MILIKFTAHHLRLLVAQQYVFLYKWSALSDDELKELGIEAIGDRARLRQLYSGISWIYIL